MDKWNNLLEFVRTEEDKYYNLAFTEMSKQNINGYLECLGQATAFQKIRYAMEDMDED
jgi:hypothetical protein